MYVDPPHTHTCNWSLRGNLGKLRNIIHYERALPYLDFGGQIQVLMLARQVLYQMSQALPVPSLAEDSGNF